MSGSSSLVASNRAVIEDFALNFGDDKDIVSLDGADKTFDAVVFDVLKVQPEDIANQLTLIDLPLFQKIGPEELTCCKWASKKKYEYCPNVVNITKRFNHVSYWVTREILSSNTAKIRAEKISHFVKVAKKLLDINSLNCLKAVTSGLQSAPIYRLNRTWNLVPKRDKEKLEKLNELVSEENNRSKFRFHLENVKLPCIPFLGMFLTDLTYINTIHPCTGGLDIERSNKMNEILRIIADFQQSSYDVPPMPHIQNYLNAVKYIDELQKFMEDDNYKLSLQIEPVLPKLREPKDGGGRARREVFSESDESTLFAKMPVVKTYSLNNKNPKFAGLNPKSPSLNLPTAPFRSPSPDKKHFVPGHRKVKSLGSNQQFLASLSAMNSSIGSSISSSSTTSRYNLVDDSLVDEHSKGDNTPTSSSYDSGLDHDEPETHPIIQSLDAETGEILTPHLPSVYFKLQGLLKRKTLLKNGTKPKVAGWQRYWIGLAGSCLVYFLPKYRGFGGNDRASFRADPVKVLPLHGCTVFLSEPDSEYFQLTDVDGENVYKFRALSHINATMWCQFIRESSDGDVPQQPTNLISFEDSDDDTRF